MPITDMTPQALYPLSKRIGLFFGPALFLLLYAMPQMTYISPDAQKVLALVLWMLTWWLTEAIPLAATSLLPIAILPFLQIEGLTMDRIVEPYSNKVIYLFMGGFVVALAMEKWNLHLRIALWIVHMTGTNANGIIWGFMLATAFLSAWISNTATTVMMLPIALSVVTLLANQQGDQNKKGVQRFAITMMLAIAYAANIGGIATLVGTPPNLVFASFASKHLGREITFTEWAFWATPFSILMLVLSYFALTRFIFPSGLGKFEGAEALIESEWKKLGRMGKAERMVLAIFVATALSWIFREPLSKFLPGLSDYNIAMIAAVSTFLAPVDFRKGKFLLTWEDMQKLPWGILLFFGSGLCLADRLDETGIVQLIGKAVSDSQMFGLLGIIIIMVVTALFLTELISNVALITIFLPIMAGICEGLGLSFLALAVPVTMASSCAFMLPMGTPPNAIVFASGHLTVAQMARAGIWLNLIGALLLSGIAYLILQ